MSGAVVAILRQRNGRTMVWSEQFRTQFQFNVPKMEDPIETGLSKIEFKDCVL
jgi:hypothetical protein